MHLESKRIGTILMTMAFLSGCATAGKDVTAIYISPTQYSNFDCDQLRVD
jgi:hypothetical protein